MSARACSLAAVALVAALPVRADECGTVFQVFEALAGVPAYAQKIIMKDMPPAETVAVGETLYVKTGADWEKLDLGPGGRLAAMKTVMPNPSSLKDCRVAGTDAIDGKPMTVYGYIPPPMGGMGGGPQKLWVGVADGLPYRMVAELEGTDVAISYDDITAPIP